MNYRIFPPEEMLETTVTLPLSKSICNRQLIINALTPGAEPLASLSDCDDTQILAKILANKNLKESYNLNGAGTALRFLTAYFAATPECCIGLQANERLCQRPMAELIEALRQLGADITCTQTEGHAPLRIRGQRLHGGEITVNADISSQFISALMMIGPTLSDPLTIHLDGEIVSRPYILMTERLMLDDGASVDFEGQTIRISPSTYQPCPQRVERDWSAASYWYGIAALSAGFITLPELSLDSIQGDRRCAPLYEMLGVNTEPADELDGLDLLASPEQFSRFDTDLSETPDLAPTMAVTAATLGIPFHLTGLSTLRNKETDRLEALRAELLKFGIAAEIRGDSQIVWNGERVPVFELPSIRTYGDHRMAMAFAQTAIFYPGIIIEDIEVVTKSYPQFWQHLTDAGFTLSDSTLPLPENTEEPE